MPETKREKFQRMLGVRLPKAVKSIELLQNLSRKSDYEYSTTERREMLDALYDAVDEVADTFGAPPAVDQPCLPDQEENRSSLPEQTIQRATEEGGPAGGGAGQDLTTTDGHTAGLPLDQRSEVRWAHDALRRNDKKLAENRLKRVIEAWIAEGG